MLSEFWYIECFVNGVWLYCVEVGFEQGFLVILLYGFFEFWCGWDCQIGLFVCVGFWVVVFD